MKRTSQQRHPRVSGKRRLPVQPALEPLEDRLAPAAVPGGVDNVAPTPPVIVQPTLVIPGNPTPAAGTITQTPPPPDEVFFNALLNLGGGHPQELLHFPASGGSHQEEKQPEPNAKAPLPGSEEALFAGELWSEGDALVQQPEMATALAHALMDAA